jgi:hypothetical protein
MVLSVTSVLKSMSSNFSAFTLAANQSLILSTSSLSVMLMEGGSHWSGRNNC